MNSTMKKKNQIPEWWAAVPPAERLVVGEVMRMVRGLKRSSVPQVAQAARSWESGLGFFIKVRLMNKRRKRRRH
jgi:hypothetical protein